MLSGDNSILSRATEAKESTERAQIEEALKLAYAELVGADYINNSNSANLAQAVTKANTQLAGSGLEIVEDSSGSATINGIKLYDSNGTEITSTTDLKIASDSTTATEITVELDAIGGDGATYYAKVNGSYYVIDPNTLNISSTGVSSIGGSGSSTITVETPTFSTANIAEATVSGTTVSVTRNSEATSGNTVMTVTATVNGTQYTKTASIKISESLPTAVGTTPYLPDEDVFSIISGTNLTNGLVITDHVNETTGNSDGNEYVWIEVPNNGDASTKGTSWPDYTSVASTTKGTDAYYIAIENALESYTATLLNGSDNKTSRMGWKDEWYDYCGATYDGEHNYSECKFAESNSYISVNGITLSCFNIAKEYYGKIYTDTSLETEATSYSSSTPYYVKISEKLNDTSGCGLSYSNYNTKKKAMLESIYTNGGFWIGRYETGYEYDDTAGVRTTADTTTQTAVIKPNAYPYNWVRTSQAESLAEGFSGTGYNATLMFGLQWDLVLKYLSNKSVITSALTSYSDTWGNFQGKSFSISNTSAKYSTDSGASFIEITSSINHGDASSVKWLLTTASNANFSKQNIYDLAGNVWERTLEHAVTVGSSPCATRGGVYNDTGINYPVSSRYGNTTMKSGNVNGFRVSLY